MDENFEYFLEKMGPAIEKRHVPPSSIERYRGKLPDRLLHYWQEGSWCGYADLHNPDMVAGGKDVISGFGKRGINSRIGAQWRQYERLTQLDKAANNVPEALRGRIKMNAKLERCR